MDFLSEDLPILETPQEIHIFGTHTMGVPTRGMGLIKAVPFKGVQVSLEDWKVIPEEAQVR